MENSTAYVTSYNGDLWDLTSKGNVSLMFNQSRDGISWEPVNTGIPSVYNGGGTEATFGFDLQGKLFSLIKNEIGDDSGWGSRLAVASHD